MVTLKVKGNFKHTESFFSRAKSFRQNMSILKKFGDKGVEVLRAATPVDTGKTADAWRYEISYLNGDIRIDWLNSNTNDGAIIAVLLQYGHGTRNGGYVHGTDYINPAMKGVFEELADEIWKELTK